MYDAKEVAKYVIGECMEEDCPVTNLKLQKILYFMWIDWFRARGEYLFDNKVEAWHFGPVIPDVYRRYRIFIADPIKKVEEHSITSRSDLRLLRALVRKYNKMTIGDLIQESHRDGSPWDKAGRDREPFPEISKELMIYDARHPLRRKLILCRDVRCIYDG